ncbi:MAG: beta strand repeat-containing protein [Acidimicrobiales bacterium]
MVAAMGPALLGAAVLGALSGGLLGPPAGAATTILYASPTGAGTTCSTPARCSLATALGTAQSGDTVVLEPGVYRGDVTLPVETGLTVAAVPGTSVTLTGTTASGSSPVLTVPTGASVTVRDVTITGGHTTSGSGGGGVVVTGGALALVGDTVSGNTAVLGGGIAEVGGTLTMLDDTVTGNTQSGSTGPVGLAAGAGIAASGGTVTISGTTITANTSAGDGGAGLFAAGDATVTITGSTVSGNQGAIGGGIGVDGASVTVTHSTVSGNTATLGGGLFETTGSLTVGTTTVSDNSAALEGGGIGALSGRVSLDTTTVAGNRATTYGGGLYASEAAVTVQASAVVDDRASDGGGIDSAGGTVTVQRSTLAGNSASAAGGGVFAAQGTWDLEASTVSGNTAPTGAGIDVTTAGTATLAADVLATPGGPPPGGECAGVAVTDAGDNIADDTTCSLAAAEHSLNGATAVDAYLGTLGGHGGPTSTVPLLTSPATPVGPDPAFGLVPGVFDLPSGLAACTVADQRGDARTAPCDAGAFEVQTNDVATSVQLVGSTTSANVGGDVTYTATVVPPTDDGAGGTLAFSDAATSATLACIPARSTAFDGATATCVVHEPSPGTDVVTARYSGDRVFRQSAPSAPWTVSVTAPSTPTTPTVADLPDPGYEVALSDGAVTGFGTTVVAGPLALAAPVVGAAADQRSGGTWEVAADGGVLARDAPFYGSMGGKHLDAPVVGMAAAPGGHGYWLVAADGGIFAFGDAHFSGSLGGLDVGAAVTGLAADPVTGGYWMVSASGGVYGFGAPFDGSLAVLGQASRAVAIIAG